MSANTRIARLQRLDRLLCDPLARRTHNRALDATRPLFGSRSSDAELSELLRRVLVSPERLELLNDDELEFLEHDPVALKFLSEEIGDDWHSCWNEPLAAVGCELLNELPTRSASLDVVSPATASGAAVDGLSVAPLAARLGEIREAGDDPEGKQALILDWKWQRPLQEFVACSPGGASSAPSGNLRRFVKFWLRAFATTRRRAGVWLLGIDGDFPREATASLRVTFQGESFFQATDQTEAVPLGDRQVEITLTDLGDPAAWLADWRSGEVVIEIEARGSSAWRVVERLPSPRLDRDFYGRWAADRETGFAACIARLRLKVGRGERRPDWDGLSQAIEEGARRVLQKRYIYRDVTSLEDFSRLVFRAAANVYQDQLRREARRREQSLGDAAEQLTNADRHGGNPAAQIALVESHHHCLQRLAPREQQVIRLHYEEDHSFQEIGLQCGITTEYARLICFRARQQLAECYRQSGFGPEDL